MHTRAREPPAGRRAWQRAVPEAGAWGGGRVSRKPAGCPKRRQRRWIRGGSWGTKRRVDFAIGGDGESEAWGSKSKRGDEPTKGYEAMQARIANRNKERGRGRERAAGKPATSSNKKKLVRKSTGKGSVEANETRARELTSLLGRALPAVQHHEENDYPKESDCTAL